MRNNDRTDVRCENEQKKEQRVWIGGDRGRVQCGWMIRKGHSCFRRRAREIPSGPDSAIGKRMSSAGSSTGRAEAAVTPPAMTSPAR